MCVCVHMQRERAFFFFNISSPQTFPTIKEMWCCLFFCLALIGFKQPPLNGRCGEGTPRSPNIFQVHNMMRMKRHTYLPWIYQSDVGMPTQIHSVKRFFFFVATKKCLYEESASCLGVYKANKKKSLHSGGPIQCST